MKKFRTIILLVIFAVGMCFGGAGCDSNGAGCDSNGDYDCKNHIHKWGTGKEFEEQGSVETVVKYTCELCGKTATEYVDTENNGVIYRVSSDGNAEFALISERLHT